jgi:hypothetical protein
MFGGIAQALRDGTYKPIFSAEQQASMDARNAHNAAAAKALAEAPALAAQRRRDEIAANQAFLDSGGADIPDNYWGDTAASRNWVNPYYDPEDPRVTNPTQYTRFDVSERGSGIRASGNSLATAFDRTIASQWLQPLDSGLTDVQEHLYGGGAGAFTPPAYAIGNLDPRQQAIINQNKELAQYKTTLRGFQNDKDYQTAFQGAGINLAGIKNAEDLAAISPDRKAAVYDIYQRIKQEKNQREKPFGFGDALGIGLAVASAFVGNPYAAAALGAGGAAARGGNLKDIALAGGIAGFANFAGGKLGEAWDASRAGRAAQAGQSAATASNVAAFGGTAADVFGQISPDLAVRGLGGTGITAGNLGSTIFNPAALGGIQGATALGTGAALGGTATNVFGALPATGSQVLSGIPSAIGSRHGVSSSITQGGRLVPFLDKSASAASRPLTGAGALVPSSAGVGRQLVHSGLSSVVNSIRAPSEGGGDDGGIGGLVNQLSSVPTITYPDYAPIRSGAPIQAGFERTSNIGVPSEYGYVPTGLTPETALPYGSGLDPYAPTTGPNFDVSPYFQSPKLFRRGGGVVNVDSGARPTDQESFYQTYESGSQQYSDNLGEGMGITYDRVEGTDIPPQSRLQVFETPPMGVGSLNGTARNMSRFAYGGGVGSLNETARAIPYADGGIVPADMVWVLDEDGVERLYPKSLVKREYSDEPLPVEGDFMANLQGIPETVERYSRPNAREERQFDDWQDNRSGLHPTASLTSLNIGTDNWGVGGRFGIGAGANTIDVGANIDRTGVNLSDLKARLGLGGVSSDLSLLGPLLDPDRFEGALNAPVGQGRVALTGGLPLKDSGEPNVALTYRQEFAVGGPIIKAASMVWQPFKVKIKNQAIFGDFMGYTKTGKVRVLDEESGVEKLYPKSRVRRAYSDEPLPDEPVKKVLGGAIVGGPAVLKTAAELLKRDPAGFFNKSQLVVQEAKLPQATGQRWQQLFQDKGINKAELGGLGLLTFLGSSGDEPITKETVAEFIDQNRLEVGEDYRSTTPSADAEEKIDLVPTDSNMFRNLNLSWPDAEGEDTSSGGFSIVIRPKEYRFGELGLVRPTQYRVINLDPENGVDSRQWRVATDDFDSQNADYYSELEGQHTDYDGTLNELKVSLTSRLRDQGVIQTSKAPRWAGFILSSPAVDRETELPDSQAAAELLNYREIALTDQQTGGLHKNTRALINKLSEQASMAAFKPITESQTQPRQHNFPENTLVHIRVTDRPISINGVDHEKVLYAEEFQSDWAQGAIGRGILRPEDISRKAELINKLSEIRVNYSTLPDFDTPEGKTLRRIAGRESSEIEKEIEALDRKPAYSPFLESGDKKGSVDQSPVLSLAISRLLKEAVDNGQDYVVFSNYKDQVTRWGETKLEPLYQETMPNLAKKIVKNLGGYVKPKFKTKEKENKYYEQNSDKVGKEEDAFFADTVIEPQTFEIFLDPQKAKLEPPYSHLSANRFVVHITDAMAKKIREEGQPVLSRAAGGPIIKGAAKVLTKPKKAPLLPAETLMATRPVEPLATTRTGYRVVNVDDAGNLVSQADARVVLPPELGSQHNVPMWLTLDDQYAVENYSHGSFEPGERRQVLLTYDFNEKDILQGNLTDVETEFSVGRAKLREMRDLYGEPISPIDEANRDRTGASAVPARTARASYATPLFDNSDPHVSDTRFNENLLVYLDEPNTPQMQERFGEEKVEQRNGFEVFQGEFGSWRYAVRGDDEKLVSVIQGVDLDDGSVVSNMYTRPDARNQGFAKLLFEKVASDKDNLAVSPHFSQSGAGFFGQRKKDGSSEGYAAGGGVSSLNGIARNMTRYAYGGGVGSMNETARSM